MDANQLPRIRSSLQSGNKYIEGLAYQNEKRFSFSTELITGVSEAPEIKPGTNGTERTTANYGVLHIYGSGPVVTKHSYSQLIELVCPDVDETEF